MSKMSWTLSTILGIASFVVAAPQARAQRLDLGNFKLPVEAHFGNVVLQPGEYNISRVEGMSAIRIKGERGTATILATSVDSEPEFDRSRMTLVNINGAFALSRFDSGTLGRRYDFKLDKKALGKNSERASAGHQAGIELGVK
jgi:hypothetical protein